MHSPMEQFEIKRLLEFKIGSLDASYTNSALWMTIAVILAFFLFVVGMQKKAHHQRIRRPAHPTVEPIAEEPPDQKARDHIDHHSIGNARLAV